MRQTARNLQETCMKLFVCTIDLEETFDILIRKEMWSSIKERGINGKVVIAVHRTESVVRTGCNMIKLSTRGIRQGRAHCYL